MSNDSREKPHSAWDTARLLEGIEPLEGDEYSVEAILAEFGQGGAKPAQKQTVAPISQPTQPAVEEVSVEQVLSTIGEIVDMPREEIAEEPARQTTKSLKKDRKFLKKKSVAKVEPIAKEELVAEEPAEFTPQEETREPAAVEETAASVTEIKENEPAEKESASQEKEIVMDRDPGEPEGNVNDVSLEQVMSETVGAVLEQDDEILEVQPTLRERLAARFSAVKEHREAKAPALGDTEEL